MPRPRTTGLTRHLTNDRADCLLMSPLEARERFRELIERPALEIPLAEACLLIAAEGRPEVRPQEALFELDRLGEAAHEAALDRQTCAGRIESLNRFLFEQEGFTGNRAEYDDPRNSFLDLVLERRTGLPITLSVVYIELGRRLDLETSGIGFPGHFLTKVLSDQGEVVIDPFYGCVLDEGQCRKRLEQIAGPDARFDPRMLQSIDHPGILRRILNNLKRLHLTQSEWNLALACCERLILLVPEDPIERLERGLVYRKLECFGPALSDIDFFLRRCPDHPSTPGLQVLRDELSRRTRHMH